MNKRVLLSGALLLAAGSAAAEPSIIPQPVEMKETGGTFILTSNAKIFYSDEVARHPAEMLAQYLRPATGFALPVKKKNRSDSVKGAIVLQISKDTTLDKEGYELVVTDQVSIKAQEAAGLFYGGQTLRQLLPPDIFSATRVSRDWTIPGVEIRDFPRFEWRGLMLDVARHFMPPKTVKKFIDTMALHKLNTFHWHLTDDQGWRIEIKKYPKLTEIGAWRDETVIGHVRDYRRKKIPFKFDGKRHGGFYTQDQIREIVRYAADRYITVVPEIDMPGHMQAAVASYPELGCTGTNPGVAKYWGVSRYILSPENSTVQFCKDVLAEIMELFPGEFIHIGGDEAKKDQWEKSERIQRLRKERGLKDMHEMQSWFIRQIDDFLVTHGRRLIGWDEIGEGGLAKNAAVMWWRGKAGRGGTAIAIAAAKKGHDIVVASNSHLYFDYYQSKDTQNEPLAIGGFLPLEKVYSFEPIHPDLEADAASHVLGVQGQLWTEYIPDEKHLEYMAYPRACALAELAWLPKEQKDYENFIQRLGTHLQRLEKLGVNFRKPE